MIVIIPGKRRPVPIILLPETLHLINLLLSYRQDTNSVRLPLTCVRSWDLIRKFSIESGLEKPHLMTSTNFWKYVATVAQLVSLSENELESLCNHMGHSIQIHRNFYRLPTAALELAHVSKLLISAEEAEIHKHVGSMLHRFINIILFSLYTNVIYFCQLFGIFLVCCVSVLMYFYVSY